ncbi:MAG: putative glycoside hydrolase [Patescibacteria group bacterium]
MKYRVIITFLSIILFSIVYISAAHASSFPRLANYYLTGGGITEQEAQELTKWDVVIMGMEVPEISPAAFALIKKNNPDVKLLVYVDSIMRGTAPVQWRSSFHEYHYNNAKSEWLLQSPQGESMTFWPGTEIMNPTDYAPLAQGKRWNDFLPAFAAQVYQKQGVWDGIFFDDAMSDISWLNNGNIDITNDGVKDAPEFIDKAWRTGMRSIYQKTRANLGDNIIIITNSSYEYSEQLNGRMFETVLTHGWKWDEQIKAIEDAGSSGGYLPRYIVVNANTDNTGNREDWRKFRFAFTSTLLTDAYFSYDYGDKWHEQIWWYDEYNVNLGNARSNAYAVTNKERTLLGVWRRDFEKGIALVNITGVAQTVIVGSNFKKINGTQDKSVNNGQRVSQITMGAYDGIVLERVNQESVPQNMTVSQGFVAGSNAELWDMTTGKSVGIMVLNLQSIPKGTFGLINDLDSDGIDETIIWKNGALTLYRNGQKMWLMYPYDKRWRGSVSLASGDVDGDGMREIVLAAGFGGGPHVRIVDVMGKLRGPGFFAGNKNSRTGTFVDVNDINGDGVDEIIAGTGRGEEPWVRIFDAKGTLLNSFLAYERNNQQGVSVVASDVNNDKVSEIFTINANHVKVYASTGILLDQFTLSNQGKNNKRVVIVQDALHKRLATY